MDSIARHKHLFYSEIAKLLEAGFDIRKAASVLKDSQLPTAQAALLKDLEQGLEAGQSITTAFTQDTKTISELERSIIGAGERGGKLAPAFQHLADYFGMLASAHTEVVRSMIYPIVVLHVGIFIATVPAALKKGDLTIIQILGGFLWALIVVYAVALLAYLAIHAVFKMAPDHPAIDRWINRIPWIGKARKSMAMARFCKVYHSCLLAGISMTETVQLASNASHSGVIREAGSSLLNSAKAGEALGPRFLADAAFPKPFARSYTTGEEAGTLDKDLASWSKRFQDEAESGVKSVAIMIPKLLYFLILMFVAWKIVSFYTEDLADTIKQLEE